MKRFEGLNPVHTPGVLVKNHGPFSWGKNAQDAVHNAVVMDKFVENRYSSYTEGIGKKIADKQTSLAELEQYTLTNGEPTAESGKQEYLEALVNQYIISAGREL